MIHVERRRRDLQLDMAPMIDMVFLLIIFFLTATTFTEREREQDVLLPSNRKPGSLSRSLDNNVIVNVLADGSVRVFGDAMDLDALVGVIRDRKARASVPIKVQVRGDRRTLYLHVAEALQAIERGGVPRPYLSYKVEGLGEAED